MDESVVRAMARWPDVPDCYGWLALTRRGEWRIGALRERIAHHGLNDFINRNYLSDERGAWYFQNGPQRVWVSLDYTPLVYRSAFADPSHLVAHTGGSVGHLMRVGIDEDGSLILVSELGPGILDDRDLAAVLPMIRSPTGKPLEACLNDPAEPLRFGQSGMPVERLSSDSLETELAFRRRPAPAPDGVSG
jgi:hypothetical protein